MISIEKIFDKIINKMILKKFDKYSKLKQNVIPIITKRSAEDSLPYITYFKEVSNSHKTIEAYFAKRLLTKMFNVVIDNKNDLSDTYAKSKSEIIADVSTYDRALFRNSTENIFYGYIISLFCSILIFLQDHNILSSIISSLIIIGSVTIMIVSNRKSTKLDYDKFEEYNAKVESLKGYEEILKYMKKEDALKLYMLSDLNVDVFKKVLPIFAQELDPNKIIEKLL